jgi:DNA-binding NarL/FixJ family response regulator
LAASALDTAEALGMRSLAESCRQLSVPKLAVVPPPAEYPDGLSAREVDVLRLIAAGRSNREIGEHLMISPNTAANHVRAILQKTACANRAEAAAYAARNDLLG